MSASPSSVHDDLVRLEHALQDAVGRQDREALERLLAPGFRLVSSGRMGTIDRETWIAAAVGPFRQHSATLTDFVVIVDFDTAVVTRRGEQDATYEGRPAPRSWLLTDVWVRRGGSWRLLARHAETLHR